MAQRNRRISKKKQQLTYEDIKDLSPEQLEQMGLGSWLKDNVGNIAMGIGGAAAMFVPGGQAAGIGMLAGAAGGFAETAGQKEQMGLQEQQIKEQNALGTANTNLQNKLNQNPLVNYVPTRRRGGKLPKMAMGGTINYEGQLHEGPNGGVPVDAQGNPNAQNPVALVEKGEVKYDTGEGDYIFSDQLELRKGKTFAKKAKDIQAKYKMRMSEGVIIDHIAKKGYDKEMQDLVKKQEKLRSVVTPQEQPMMRTGGNLPKYDGTTQTPGNTSFLNFNPKASFNTWQPEELDYKTLRQNYYRDNSTTWTPPKYNFNPAISTFNPLGQGQDFGIKGSNNFSTPEDAPKNNLYQGMNWAETGLQMIPGIASGVSNILMARSRKRAAENMTKLQAPQIVAQQVNLEPARAGIREQGNVARANTSRGLRGSSTTPGQYMSNIIAAETGIQRGVGEGINQLNIQEQIQNVSSRQSADTFNAQMQARADEINYMKEQQALDAYYNQLAGGIGQIGQGITGALSTKASSAQAANMMQMMHPNYELTVDGDPIWGIGNKIRRTPRRT